MGIFARRGIDAHVRTDLTRDELIEIVPDYDGLAVRSATKVTEKVVAAADNLAYRPLEAEALLQLGKLQYRSEDPNRTKTTRRAVLAAISGRHLKLVAAASVELLWISVLDQAYDHRLPLLAGPGAVLPPPADTLHLPQAEQVDP